MARSERAFSRRHAPNDLIALAAQRSIRRCLDGRRAAARGQEPRPSGPNKYPSYSNYDVWQPTVDDEEAVLDRVLRNHSRDLTANAEIDMVNTGLPLRGAALVRNWRARTADSMPVGALGTLPRQDDPGRAQAAPCAHSRLSPTAPSSPALTQLSEPNPLSIISGV